VAPGNWRGLVASGYDLYGEPDHPHVDHGCSSILAAATLVDLGFTRAADVIGGFAAWRDAGLPTIPARATDRAPGELPGMRGPDH
jgi:hypothetical protein